MTLTGMAYAARPGSIAEAIRRRWFWAVVVCVSVFAGASWYANTLPSEYTTSSILAIAPRPSIASADTVRLVAPKFVAYVLAPPTIADAAAELGLDPGAVNDALDASLQAETGNVVIEATWGDPATAASVVEVFTGRAVDLADGDGLVSAEVISPAFRPTTPSGPPRRLLQASGLVLGAALGLGLALLLERFRPKITDRRQLQSLTDQHVLATIPRIKQLRARQDEAFSVPSVGTAFRTLRANLEHRLQGGARSLGVTSSVAGEGKSTVAAMLAEAFARGGQRVLLVDADLRRPSLAARFTLADAPGTVEFLRGKAELDDAVRPGWVEHLDVVTTAADPEAGDLFVTAFRRLVDAAADRYDVTLVDLPPLVGHEDARIAATALDGIVLVASGLSTPDGVHESTLALEMLQVPLTAVVANGLFGWSDRYP